MDEFYEVFDKFCCHQIFFLNYVKLETSTSAVGEAYVSQHSERPVELVFRQQIFKTNIFKRDFFIIDFLKIKYFKNDYRQPEDLKHFHSSSYLNLGVFLCVGLCFELIWSKLSSKSGV